MENYFNIAAASFVTGIPTSAETGWIVVTMKDLNKAQIEHSGILKYDGEKFLSVCLKMFKTRAIEYLPQLKTVIIVSGSGACTSISADGIDNDESIASCGKDPAKIGPLRSAIRIGEEIIVVGMQRQVYRRKSNANWSEMMLGLPVLDRNVSGFECAAAVAPDEIYAAGWHGEIWLYNGHTWNQLKSPTDRIITSLCVGSNGELFGCGQRGLLITGRKDKWQKIENSDCNDDLWAIQSVNGTLFVSGLNRLYTFNPGKFQIENRAEASSFGSLAWNENILWSIGEKDLLAFDGVKWRSMI